MTSFMNSINCGNEGLSCALINARSVGNKSSQVLDLIMENNLDILVITETWLFSGEQAKLNMITPEGYISFSKPRDERKGAIICQNELKCETKNSSFHPTSFEFLHIGITINNKYLSLYTIYRPEPNVEKMSVFFDEFATYLENWTLVSHDVLILGDFNIHIDLPNDSKTSTFVEILKMFNLVQHVVAPTHESGHTIDLIISHPNDFVYNVVVNEHFSDHKTVSFTLRAIKPPSKSETVTSRNIRSINMEAFTQDITTCLANNEISTSIPKFNDRVKWYDTILSALTDKHAPLKNRIIHIRPRVPWMNNDIMVAKRLKRKDERRWRLSKLNFDKATYKNQKKKYDLILKEALTKYMSNLVLENAGNPKSLFKLIGSFLNIPMKNPLP